MGCFSIWKSKRSSADRPLLPPSQPLCLIYENKPTALPDPAQVETELKGRLSLSATPSFNERHRDLPCGSPSPVIWHHESKVQSAKNKPCSSGRSKLQEESSAWAILCSRITFPVYKRRQRSVSGLWNSGPLVGSYTHSGPIFAPSAFETDFHSCRDPFPALPLPLPHDPLPQPPQVGRVASVRSLAFSPCCSTAESFRVDFSGSLTGIHAIHPEPLPTPDKLLKPWQLRSFAWEELAGRCLGFSDKFLIGETGSGAMYKTWIDEEGDGCCRAKQKEVTVFIPEGSAEVDEEFTAHITSLAEAHNSHLCMLVGYSMENNSSPNVDNSAVKRRLILFERLGNGTLDSHLHGQDHRSPLDWSTRMRVALDAARGLMELQHKFPDKAMYLDFRSLYIELDHNLSGKLTGYGSTKGFMSEDLAKKNPKISKHFAPETAAKGELSVKSTVWSFGLLLLELLTGHQNCGEAFLAKEQDLAKWGTSVLQDVAKLFQALDPQLRGCYPTKHVKTVGNLILQCLHKDPHCRPSLCYVVEVLRSVNLCMPRPECLSKNEPAATVRQSLSRCTSLKQALHQQNVGNDPLKFPFGREIPSCLTVNMQGHLHGNSKNSLSDASVSSRSTWSCSSSFALERNQSSTCCKMQVQQTG